LNCDLALCENVTEILAGRVGNEITAEDNWKPRVTEG